MVSQTQDAAFSSLRDFIEEHRGDAVECSADTVKVALRERDERMNAGALAASLT